MNVEETAKFLGMSPHDIPILVANGLLKPLGNPGQSTVKYFATVTLQELCGYEMALSRQRYYSGALE
jgi:hypothetical protein